MKLIVVLLLLFCFDVYAHHKQLHFALFTQRAENDAFWGPAEDFAQATQEQLNVKVSIYYARSSKSRMIENLNLAKLDGVDAVIFPNLKRSALAMLQYGESLEMPMFLFNANIAENNQRLAGKPRQFFSYWLASLMPDDEAAGYLLAKRLIHQARENQLTDTNSTVYMAGISGTITDSPAILRQQGLERAVKEDGNVELVQVVNAYWQQDTARFKATHLINRYPNIKVFWTASDLMSLGVYEAMSAQGKKAGLDYLTGGIDWSIEGLEAIKDSTIQASIGGQFMEAAWAVIMLHDHFHGIDFNNGRQYQFLSKMADITPSQVKILLPHLQRAQWNEVDFKSRSRFFNPSLLDYDLDPSSIFKDLEK